MVIGKIQKPLTAITPQELAQKIANEGLRGAVDKAVEASEKEYRAHYKKLLESKKSSTRGITSRFRTTEADADQFLDQVYANLPAFFKKMIDDAVEEQGKFNGLSEKHKLELKRELSNVIDQELRLKGKFA